MKVSGISLAGVSSFTNQGDQTRQEACDQKGGSGGSIAMLGAAAAAAAIAIVPPAPDVIGAIQAASDKSAVAKDLPLGRQVLERQDKLGNFDIQSLMSQFDEAQTPTSSDDNEKYVVPNNILKNLQI